MKKILLSLVATFLFTTMVFGQQLTVNLAVTDANTCKNNNGTITSTVTGGVSPYSFFWSNSKTTKDIDNLAAGNYSVTVTDAVGGVAYKQALVNNVSTPIVITETHINTFCGSLNSGSITPTASGGTPPYSYFWSNGEKTQVVNNLISGTYHLTVADAAGCINVKSVNIDYTASFVIKSFVTDQGLCENTGTIDIVINGGVPPYSYQWKDTNGANLPFTTQSINVPAGDYKLIVTDNTGCIGSKYITVGKVKISPQAWTISSNCEKQEGAIYCNPTGSNNLPYTFSWTGPKGFTSINQNLTSIGVGTYFVTITDAKGCTSSSSVIVPTKNFSLYTKITAACGSDLGQATANVVGGTPPYQYTWSNGGSSSNVLGNIKAGEKYNVSVVDANGCEATARATFDLQNQLPINVLLEQTLCPTLKAISKINNVEYGTPPFSYQWSNGSTSNILPLYPLQYGALTTVTITDSKGCTGTGINPVAYDSHWISSFYTLEKCENTATIIPKCPDLKFTYKWDNGSTNSSATNLSAGFHKVTVTDTYHKSSNIDTVTIYPNIPCPSNTYIQGTIKRDANDNCIVDANESPYKNQIVSFLPGPVYASTDDQGNYKAFMKPGDYTASTTPFSPYEKPCQDNIPVTLVNTATVDFPIKVTDNCPYMEVDISTPFLRRCFDNVYSVYYCNYGTAIATGATVTVDFDKTYMIYKGASIPLASLNNGVLTFNIGDVAVGECKSFTITLNVDCTTSVLGQTHCVKAHITPDALCKTAAPNWSGAKVAANAQCNGQEVVLSLKNTGNQAMSTTKNYIIIEDQVIYKQGQFKLNANEVLDIKMPANGKTYRIEAEQEGTFFFATNKPSAWVEACGNNGQGTFSKGFVGLFGKGDGDPFNATDCHPSIGSYDPNEKSAYPIGYNAAHLLDRNEDIDYTLHFQNEGTDTAFTVVLRDTLSTFLDAKSIRMGASSHPMKWNMSSNGLLTVTFDKINLTSKKQSEALSQGFVKFRIAQQKDLPLGTVIKNRAGIYFDYNSVVLTNEVFHTIGKNFIQITTEKNTLFENLAIKVYPNPTDNEATFDISGTDLQSFELNIYDLMGRLVRSEKHESSMFQFQKGNLDNGLYIYQIKSGQLMVGNGKIRIY